MNDGQVEQMQQVGRNCVKKRQDMIAGDMRESPIPSTAKWYLTFSLIFLGIGGTLALIMRWHLGYPESEIPLLLLGPLLPESIASSGLLLPGGYGSLFTMHGTIMMFFALIPALLGYGGYGIALREIRAEKSAITWAPIVGLLGLTAAGILIVGSFFVDGGPASFGWTAYVPLSVVDGYTGAGAGADLWVVGMIVYGLSLLLVSVDLLSTFLKSRSEKSLWSLPPVSWSLFISVVLLTVTLPVLAVGLFLLASDRLLETSFFLPDELMISGEPLGRGSGGEPLLWQHLFWYFGHPVVYVLILPLMGAVSTIFASNAGRPLHGPRSMKVATGAIALLGMVVWGHHMFQTDLNPLVRSTFVLSSLMIAVPSTLKVYHWIRTLFGGTITFSVPMLFAIGFLLLFIVGGLSGLFLASTPVDMYLHDGYFVVAHIHYVLFGGSILGFFGAIYHWSGIGGRSRKGYLLGALHFAGTFVGMNLVFFPMHFLGVGGYPRRLFDASGYEYLGEYAGLNEFMTMGAVILGASQVFFLLNGWSGWRNRVGSRIDG